MIFHENRLLADDSRVISYLILVENWPKMSQTLSSAAVVIGALRFNSLSAQPHTFMEIDMMMKYFLQSFSSFRCFISVSFTRDRDIAYHMQIQ